MTMTITQQIITVAVVVLGTMTTRFLPFLIFPEGKEPPAVITYLGTVLPYADRTAGGVLPERCSGKRPLWDTGTDCHFVYRGTA